MSKYKRFDSFTSPRFSNFGQARAQNPNNDFFMDPLGARGDIMFSPPSGQMYQQGSMFKSTPNDVFARSAESMEFTHPRDFPTQVSKSPAETAERESYFRTDSDNSVLDATDRTPLIQPTRKSPAVAAAASGSRASSAAGASSSQSTQAMAAGSELMKQATKGVFDFLNVRESGKYQEEYLKNINGRGDIPVSMHTGLHSNMKYSAQMQTLKERQNIMDLTSAVAGPLGAVAGFFGSKLHTSDQEKNLDYNTAWSSNGGRADPGNPMVINNDSRNQTSTQSEDGSASGRTSITSISTNRSEQSQTQHTPQVETEPKHTTQHEFGTSQNQDVPTDSVELTSPERSLKLEPGTNITETSV